MLSLITTKIAFLCISGFNRVCRTTFHTFYTIYTFYAANQLHLIPSVRATFKQLAYEDVMRG